MNVFASSILSGIISGVLVAVAMFLFRVYWLKVLQPWYEDRIYQDAKIEGEWLTTIDFPDNTTNTHRIHLERVGHSVHGSVICISGYSEGQAYSFAGTFKNLLLTADYQVTNSRNLERGTFTLMLIEGGSRLRGYITYYDSNAHDIMTAPCEWVAASDVTSASHNPTASADQKAPPSRR